MSSLIARIHWWNIRISPPLGLLTNFALFWLVLNRTPKEMMVHSRILLQTAIFDSIFLVISSIGTPICLVANEILTLSYDGLFFDGFYAIFGNLGGSILHAMYYTFLMFEMLSVSVQFLYRYLILNCNIHIGIRRYLLLLIAPAIGAFIIGPFSLIFLQPTNQIQLENVQSFGNHKFYFIFYYKKAEALYIFYIGMLYFTFMFAYVLITYCAVKMIKHVNGHTGLSENVKRLNRQLTKTLIILAALPCLDMFLSVFLTLNGALPLEKFFDTTSNTVGQTISNQLFILLPCLNPLVSISTNTPYRNAVLLWRKSTILPEIHA